MNGITYLTIKDVAEKLKLKSVDSAARWCSKQKIEILFLGNRRVVPEFAFILAYEQPLINQLKFKYGNNWFAYYEAYKNQDVKMYSELEKKNMPMVFKPSRFDADAFLNDIKYGKS
ncbi:MAG: hypothetical protein CVU00_02555 [Bacteroidetes bacterium HGW-Bacteroidetes-17]|jgi:hypothetical protein|nr:MAG: hypothetical protein CVU00_02555 [Bacteroidetes bacterium HGW-Bacteroidetes-17]